MIKIPGYSIGDEIYNGPSTLIYRAKRDKDDNPVIIKLLKKEYPTPLELSHFQHEYEILTSINGAKGIVKTYDILDYWNSKAIVMEDIGGESLENLIKKSKITLKSFLVIGIKLCDIIESIHKNNIIHKDIKPQNILLNTQTGEVELIDFSISTRLLKDNQEIVEPGSLEGTLQYISPEQTGRMNRSIDYRTDFYSLGVTFYEMLTGRLPFDSNDPMELVHAHIAKIPVPPHTVKSDIPEVVSKIILKLMSKNAEDRYQGTWGLKDDLTRCYKELKDTGKVSDFEIAANDVSGRFQIPEKLYGREKEREQILGAFDQVAAGGKRILFITGESGIGKTAIIHEVQKPIVEKHGFFISGKYDKFKRNIPYSAIIQAFQELVRQILTKDEEKQKQWKTKILDTIGSNGKLITEIIPQIELIIGEQPPVQELPPQESQNRFNMVFQNFVKSFTGSDHPLVLFLDDLQWMDLASLNLIQVLFSDTEFEYFLFCGSYRDNEVDAAHPLHLALEKLKNDGIQLENIQITHLRVTHIESLISDTLHLNNGQSSDLAALTEQKTGGNPFFVIEFLKKLNEDTLIVFDGKWSWDIKKIKAASITDNVVDLMAEKIKKLPPATKEVLKLSACIGVKTYINTLAIIYGKSESDTLNDLTPAINEGMIIKIEDDTKFVHDRVREAAYSLIDAQKAKELHHKIGTTLLNHPQIRPFEERVFSIVNQLMLCKDLLNEDEKKKLIELSITAAKKAKANAAWDAACGFFTGVNDLMGEDSWQTDYIESLDYYTEWAEAEYTATHYDKAEELYNIVIKNAKTIFDKTKVSNIKILSLVNLLQFSDAIKLGSYLLNKLRFRIKYPKSTSPLSIITELVKSNRLIKKNLKEFGTNDIQELIRLPEVTDKTILLSTNISTSLVVPALFDKNSNYFPYLSIWITNHSLKYGLTPSSSIGFAGLATVHVIAFKAFDKAYNLSLLAEKIINKYNDNFNRSYILCSSALLIHYWKKRIVSTIEMFQEAFEDGYISGNYQWATYAIIHKIIRLLISGREIPYISEEMVHSEPPLKKMNQQGVIPIFNMCRQTIFNLMSKSDSPYNLSGAYFDQSTYNTSDPGIISALFFFKLFLCVFTGNFEKGQQYINHAISAIKGAQGFIHNIWTEFFVCIVMIKARNETRSLKKIKKIIMNLKNYSRIMPENFEPLFLIADAEYERIAKKPNNVVEKYEKAITRSEECGFLHLKALAHELASEYFIENNLNKTAQYFLTEARYLYDKLGAATKVDLLEKSHPELLTAFDRTSEKAEVDMSMTQKISSKLTPRKSTVRTGNILDIGTVLKSARALSGEIEMKSLLTKMIAILMENAGAEKGILILPKGDELFIEAVRSIKENYNEVLQSRPIDKQDFVPSAIIRYVSKTKEMVVLDNASASGKYTEDEYIKINNVKSLLCNPILNQGKLVGVLYLENNLSVGTFTAERVEMLDILSAQAAISIENARLIENMKEKERLKQEMEIAERIQTSLCPPIPAHKDFEMTAIMKPAEEVGGDYYDISFDVAKNLWVAIGDVSGHGVTPGLIMMMAQTAFNTHLSGLAETTPKSLINNVNTILNTNIRNRLHEKHFMTMNFLKYCGNGKFLQAGSHLDILVYRKKNKKCEIINTKGVYLGIVPNISDSLSDIEFFLDSGDILFLFTDGIIEAQNEKTELWGQERLIECIEKSAEKNIEEIKDSIINEAMSWCRNKPLDDMTLVVSRRK